MASKKKDLEIIYNLQWKNKPANGGDKANIIGMYDIPATTLNWEIFKSYLLKNSGTVGDDVKVSYITDSNREFPIESQTDFQIALYAFRRKARLGDIVNLKLDRISERPTHKNSRHSNDVETQSDNNEATSLISTCCNASTPPEWFITYMSQFKKNITEELTTTLSSIVSNIKPHAVSQPSCYHGRKSKTECPKRIRKLPALIADSSHETKDLIKSLKLEGKLERKLEKLEHKTKKIKDKKLALLTKSSDSDAGQSSSRSHSYRHCEKEEDLLLFDAAPVNTQGVIPHMLGGEIYLHRWEVMNTGKLPWTSKTTLNFTWGSKALKPLESVISVPYLRPGETGTLAVRLQIPNQPGQYECYWHFHQKERRFGHWLGCQVIVDPFDLKGAGSVLETSFMAEFISNPKKFKANDVEYDIDEAVTQYSEGSPIPSAPTPDNYTFNIEEKYTNEEKPEETIKNDDAKNILDQLVRGISSRVEDMKLQDPTDTNCSSDSDNQSIISLTESNYSSKGLPDEFFVVPIPDCFKVDQVVDVPEENVKEEQNRKENVELVTDSVPLSENTKKISEEVPDNYDNNNNSEEPDQNSSASNLDSKIEDDLSSNDESHKSDIVIVTLPNEKEQYDAGYAYIIIDGNKVPIPKKMLKSEYLKAAEDAPGSSKGSVTRTVSSASSVEIVDKEEIPEMNKEEEIPEMNKEEEIPQVTEEKETSPSTSEQQEPIANISPETNLMNSNQNVTDSNGELLSFASVAEASLSEASAGSRLFIFPQNRPGYEVHVAEDAFSSPPLNLSTHDRNPFITGTTVHVPNYQQTPPHLRQSPPTTPVVQTTPSEDAYIPPAHGPAFTHASGTTTPESVRPHENAPPVHILPETLVSGAVNVASSAINTARSVINMIVTRESPVPTNSDILQQPGRWVNGHWISTNPEAPREANLQALAEMGFWNRDLNATLLARYNDDLSRVVAELVQ